MNPPDTPLKIYLPSVPDLPFADRELARHLNKARFDLIDRLVENGYAGDSILGERPWIRDMFDHSHKAGAFIFPPLATLPDEGGDQAEALQRWFEFVSIVTGTHIGSRENYHPDGLAKPCVLMDPNGRWALAIDILKDLKAKGMFSSDMEDIARIVRGDPAAPDDYRALNAQAVDELKRALAEERRKSLKQITPMYGEDHHFPAGRKDIKRHPFGVAVFGSAMTKETSYLQCVHELGKLAGQRGWRMVSGAGNFGCMGAADVGFEEGRQQFNGAYPNALFKPAHVGVSTQAILRLEGPPKNLDQLIIAEDIYERMQIMIRGRQSPDAQQRTRDAVKVFYITPGGTGTLHEFATLMQLATNGGMMEGRTVVLLNPPSHIAPQEGFWKKLIETAQMLGFRSRFEVADSPQAALDIADRVYLAWQAGRPEHKNLPHPVFNP